MGKVITIANQKGGVGKTTTAVALAGVLRERGYKVLVIDADDTGNPSMTKSLLEEEANETLTDLMYLNILERDFSDMLPKCIHTSKEGIDFIPADNKLSGITTVLTTAAETKRQIVLREIVNKVRDSYDYIILDAAPALNLMSINVLMAADEVIITTQPQAAAEEGIFELLTTILNLRSATNHKIIVRGLLITMVDVRTKYNKETSDKMTMRYEEFGMKVFDTRIPRAVVAESWVESKESIIKYAPESKPAMAYRQFVEEYLRR